MKVFINEKEQRLRAGWRLLFQFLLMFFILGLTGFAFSNLLPDSLLLSSVIPTFIGVVTSVWIAAQYFDKRAITDYGLNFNKRWATEFLVGAGIAAAAIGTVFLIEWWACWIRITGYGWNVPVETSFGIGFTSFFLSMLLVGFHEELFSRGYQILNLTEGFRFIGQRGAIFIAVLLTSSLFGFLHFFNPNASLLSTFNITLAGVVLAIPYLLTGSLALSTGLHFSWNFVMAGVLGFPVSGKEIEFSVLHITQGGAELITGGAFGPEAGLLGLLGMAIMAGGSCVYLKMAGYELTVAELFTKEYQPTVKSHEQTI